MKQATTHTTMHSQSTHTSLARCIYSVATIPTSFQPHPPQSVPHPHTQLHTQYFLQHIRPSTIINHDTSSPSNNHPYILIHNHYILHKTRHPTNNLNLYRNTTPIKMYFAPPFTPFTSTSQAEQFLTTPHCHLHTKRTHSTKLTTLNLHFTCTKHTHIHLPYKEPTHTSISQHTHKTS